MAHSSALRPGLGLAARDQLVPSQRRISVRSTSDAVPQPDMQEEPAAHALPPGPALTEFRTALRPGLGLAACDQLVPSQRRISVRKTRGSEAVPQPDTQEAPTTHALPPGPALTPVKALWPGLGLAACDQLVPSQRKISVRKTADAVPQPGAQE